MSAILRRAGGQRGAVALEFALVVPLFLLLVAGIGTIGHALALRYQLSDAAMVAARGLSLSGKNDVGTAEGIVRTRLGGAAESCGALQLTVDTLPLSGGSRALRVALACEFKTGIALGLLRAAGVPALHLAVSAATPL
jgi:Flp pilus assembly protein TadG